jgi:hypothetical protein
MKKLRLCCLPLFALSLVSNLSGAQTVETPSLETPALPGNVFIRMFPDLPAFAEKNDTARAVLQQLGARGEMLNAQDNLTDPVQSITNPAVFSPNNRDNPNMTAGVTFLGQFLDHDLSFDRDSELNQNEIPRMINNFRTAAFDLDTVYGAGPAGSPQLYETRQGRTKFIVQPIPGAESVSRNGAPRNDLPRKGDTAVIGDSRNDENAIISQFHLAMLSFHNAVTDYLADQPAYRNASAEKLFNDARRLVTWHYQWIILHEFLPVTIGQDRVDQILRGGLKYFKPELPSNHIRTRDGHTVALLPIEFTVGAYRFGHSQIRPSYRLNFGPTGGTPFFAFLFDDAQSPSLADPNDLRGGKRAPRRFVDWQTFFDFGDGNSRPNKRIDTKLSSVVMALPGARALSPGLPSDGLQSLPARTLTRHVNFGLPSGQDMARRMNLPVLAPAQLSELAQYAPDSRHTLDTSTPLFFYVLKEAELMENGLRLGPLGSRIVGEVFIGALKADDTSYLSVKPGWKPTLPSEREGRFLVTDLLKFAGVVPAL